MELYGKKSSSIGQKILILLTEASLLFIAYQILFNHWDIVFYRWMSLPAPTGNHTRNVINFIFSCIVFVRFAFMMFYLMKRAIPVEEALAVPMAFALYYIGFALFTVNTSAPLGVGDYIGVVVFVIGSFINTYSELQRDFWKAQPQHGGRLYTQGLFKYAIHINYFGDVMWVGGYAIITHNVWAGLIPLWLFCFFVFYNIPKLDDYLKEKYKEQFIDYRRRSKKIIPFIY